MRWLLAVVAVLGLVTVTGGAANAAAATGHHQDLTGVSSHGAVSAAGAKDHHPAVADADTHGSTVTGTVTDADGDPVAGAYVVAQPAFATAIETATNGSRPVGTALLELATDPPRGVVANTSDADGRYHVDLAGQGQYDVVAVTPDGRVSATRTVEVGDAAVEVALAVDLDRVLTADGSDVAGTPGRTTTVTVRVANTDDRPVRNLSVSLGPLPSGWSVAGVETVGRYLAADRTVRWDRVGPGETATARVTLAVPHDTALDTYAIGLSADAEAHYVEHTDAVRVRVSPPNSTKTPKATPTPLGGADAQPGLDTRTPHPGATGLPPLSVGVFAAGVAVAAYAVGRTGLPYVGRNAD